MANNFESLNNLEDHVRKSSVVQERTGLVAVHMYKQFLDFQKSTQNTAEIFIKMADIMNQERMDEAKARVSEDWGALQEISSITTTEVTQRGTTAAVAYVAASYENVDIRYTFAFDENLKLASLGIQ